MLGSNDQGSITEDIAVAFIPEVEFPSDPFEATFIYFALMAYPEFGAGERGKAGAKFADALASYSLFKARQTYDLGWLRKERQDATFCPPQKRQFERALLHGRQRIEQRFAAYDLYGEQMLQGLFQAMAVGTQSIKNGRPEDVYHMNPTGGPSPMRAEVIRASTPGMRKLLSQSANYWASRLGLNEPGRLGESQIAEKAKNLRRRAFVPSIPVLHMVHAFNECSRKFGPRIDSWEERDPVEAMLFNGSLWIGEAIVEAEKWRIKRHPSIGLSLKPDMMVRLTTAV